MKLASIVPGRIAEHVLTDEDDYHLLIAQEVMESPEYREFYHARGQAGDWILLDNGAYEAHALGTDHDVSADVLAKAIDALGFLPAEVVLPDVPGSSAETLQLSTEVAYELKEKWLYIRFMVVPHARALEEYAHVTKYLCTIPSVQSVGISFIAAKHLGCTRSEMIRVVHNVAPSMDIHLLGYRQDALPDEDVLELCRGIDTAKHVRMAMEGNKLDASEPVVVCEERPPDYFQFNTQDAETLKGIAHNIHVLREHLQ